MKIRVNLSAKAKAASRCRFGALLVDFWPPRRALLASLGRPEALLGRFGAALGPQKVKNELGPKLPFDSWRPNSLQEVEKDAFQDVFFMDFHIFFKFYQAKMQFLQKLSKNTSLLPT